MRVSEFFSVLFFFDSRDRSPSALRKAQDSLSDPKYSGKRVSRAQLLDDDDEQSLPSDSPVEDSESDDQSQNTQEGESDIPETSPQPRSRPDVVQTMSQARQDDQKKGLAVSRQLVRYVHPFSEIHLTS